MHGWASRGEAQVAGAGRRRERARRCRLARLIRGVVLLLREAVGAVSERSSSVPSESAELWPSWRYGRAPPPFVPPTPVQRVDPVLVHVDLAYSLPPCCALRLAMRQPTTPMQSAPFAPLQTVPLTTVLELPPRRRGCVPQSYRSGYRWTGQRHGQRLRVPLEPRLRPRPRPRPRTRSRLGSC